MDYNKNGEVISDISKSIVPNEICKGVEAIWMRVKKGKDVYEPIGTKN